MINISVSSPLPINYKSLKDKDCVLESARPGPSLVVSSLDIKCRARTHKTHLIAINFYEALMLISVGIATIFP